MTTTLTTINALREIRQRASQQHQRIGLVATMGNLHAGHASLLQRSTQENDITVLSIFVNPTQFNCREDLMRYPQTPEADRQLVQQHNADYLFLPTEKLLYPNGYHYKITENDISTRLEGAARPGHFDGVLTVVMKLLQIIQPDYAYFGKKDYQQYQLIRGLCEAFFLNTTIVGCDTIREKTGLPYSSRNNLLSDEQRQFAASFSKLLASNNSCAVISGQLIQAGFRIDYIEEYQNRRYGAVFVDDIRLIDNVPISDEPQPC